MKILVADDEPTVRRIMQAFLEKNHYEVVMADCGKQAFEALTAEGGPSVAILDWMMPDLTGPEVCAKLRQTKLRIRPYILMLTSKSGEADLAASLDSGADDFLTKPFRPAEMLARLRVAERLVACSAEAQERIEELEVLVERHKLLGEMVARPAHAGAAEPGAPAPAPAEPSVPKQSDVTADPEALLASDDVVFVTAHALRELGLDAKATRRDDGTKRPYRVAYTAWSGLVFTQKECWMDLLLEADPLSVNTIFARALNRPPSPTHCQTFVVEALTIISASLRATLQSKGHEMLAPFLAQGLRVDRTYQQLPVPERSVTYFFELAGAEIAMTVVEQRCPIREATARALASSDILAECYPPPESSDVALLNRGAVLNERYIEKLVAYGDTTANSQPVKIFKATPLARSYRRKNGGC